MKRVLLAAGMALALSAPPMAAQTRVSVAVGFGVPRPYVTGVVILGRPPVYYPHRRAFYYRPPLFVARRVTWFGIGIIITATTTMTIGITTATMIDVSRGPYHRSAACQGRFRMRRLTP